LPSPLRQLDRHGVRSEDVLAAQPGPGLAAVLAQLRARVGAHLAEAKRQWTTVPAAAVPAFLPIAMVTPLLDRMEASPDPFVPVELPQWRRQWLMWRAARRGLF